LPARSATGGREGGGRGAAARIPVAPPPPAGMVRDRFFYFHGLIHIDKKDHLQLALFLEKISSHQLDISYTHSRPCHGPALVSLLALGLRRRPRGPTTGPPAHAHALPFPMPASTASAGAARPRRCTDVYAATARQIWEVRMRPQTT
jgi:hypothetical protein